MKPRVAAALRAVITLLLALQAFAACADNRWYKVEVLVFRQFSPTQEDIALRDPANAPANLMTLHQSRGDNAAPGSGRVRLEPKPSRAHAAAVKRPALDPALAAQVAAAERAEAAQRLALDLNTPVALNPDWAFVQLKPAALDLALMAQRLAQRPGYTVLRLVGWVQPLDEGTSGTPVQIVTPPTGAQGGGRAVLAGYVTLRRGAKLDLDVALWLQDDPWPTPKTGERDTGAAPAPDVAGAVPSNAGRSPTLATTDAAPRRVGLRDTVHLTSGQVQYIDSPQLGALVRVDLVSRPVQQRLEASE